MNAKRYIENSLIDLLKVKSIDKIKVSEVLRISEVSKGTFYRYYCDKYDLLQKAFNNLVYNKLTDCTDWCSFVAGELREFAKCPDIALNAFNSSDVNSLRTYNETFLKALLESDVKRVYGDDISKICSVSIHICALSFTDMIINWLRTGMNETVDELLSYMRAAMPHSICPDSYTSVTA